MKKLLYILILCTAFACTAISVPNKNKGHYDRTLKFSLYINDTLAAIIINRPKLSFYYKNKTLSLDILPEYYNSDIEELYNTPNNKGVFHTTSGTMNFTLTPLFPYQYDTVYNLTVDTTSIHIVKGFIETVYCNL